MAFMVGAADATRIEPSGISTMREIPIAKLVSFNAGVPGHAGKLAVVVVNVGVMA